MGIIPTFEADKQNILTASPDITIIIPAAGASSRVGKPKQLLPWKKTTLLGHAISVALQSEARDVLVILGYHEAEIKKEIEKYPAGVLYNKNWESGLGSSIACGVKQMLKTGSDAGGALIMLADQPLMDRDHLNLLIRSFQDHPQKIVATAYGKRAGVPAVFGRYCFEALAGLQGDYGAKYLIKARSRNVIALDPGKKASDIDTLEDYEKLRDEGL